MRGIAGKALLFFVAVLLAVPEEAQALNRRSHYTYGETMLPISRVGDLDPVLSRECQQRRFGQVRPYYMVIKFKGEKGTGVSGIATSNWNLYDPYRLATPRQTFHFVNEGYSNCRVYVSPQPDS